MSNPEERACMRRSGPNCKYVTTALSYWCVNKACCRYRGTSIPGVINCPFYCPVEEPSFAWENLLITGLLVYYVNLTIILAWSLI